MHRLIRNGGGGGDDDDARKSSSFWRKSLIYPVKLVRGMLPGSGRRSRRNRRDIITSPSVSSAKRQLENLKRNPKVLNEIFGITTGFEEDLEKDGDWISTSSSASSGYDGQNFIQQIEDSCSPLRVKTPIPANEQKRLRVLNDLRLVQYEMSDGTNPVGNGFEYHRNELISTIVKILQQDTSILFPGCSPFALQIVGDVDSYTLTGKHTKVPIVTPRVQVPCQHVLCLPTTTSSDSVSVVDGGGGCVTTNDNVLAMNLRSSNEKDYINELTNNFCYTPDTMSYVGAAITINDVTIGSLCMASTKTLQELQWNTKKSKYLRQVATILEEQLTKLCIDYTLYNGELPSIDWNLNDILRKDDLNY